MWSSTKNELSKTVEKRENKAGRQKETWDSALSKILKTKGDTYLKEKNTHTQIFAATFAKRSFTANWQKWFIDFISSKTDNTF